MPAVTTARAGFPLTRHGKPPWWLPPESGPRTVQEILDHAEELARRFEDYDPDATDASESIGLNAVRDAVIARSQTELALAKAVTAAHRAGHSWQSIGVMLGTSGEAARQRYGTFERKPRRSRAAAKKTRK